MDTLALVFDPKYLDKALDRGAVVFGVEDELPELTDELLRELLMRLL